jgi:hypothetical protein
MKIDHASRACAIGAIPGDRTFSSGHCESQHAGKDRAGGGHIVEQQRHAMEATDGMLGWDVAVAPSQLGPGVCNADQG